MLLAVGALTYHCMMLLVLTRRRFDSHDPSSSKIASFGDLGFVVSSLAGRLAINAMIVLSQPDSDRIPHLHVQHPRPCSLPSSTTPGPTSHASFPDPSATSSTSTPTSSSSISQSPSTATWTTSIAWSLHAINNTKSLAYRLSRRRSRHIRRWTTKTPRRTPSLRRPASPPPSPSASRSTPSTTSPPASSKPHKPSLAVGASVWATRLAIVAFGAVSAFIVT